MYRILVVDDDEIVQQVLKHSLEAAGFEVVICDNGKRAFSVAEESKPDLILLDVNLPGKKGLNCCKELKADPRLQHIPIIVISGEYVEEKYKARGLNFGADDYLTKPFDRQELLARVRALLKSRLPDQ